VLFGAGPVRALADGTAIPSFLLFGGTDLWRYAAFAYGGVLWSPSGLDAGGFTLKMLLDAGGYTYPSGALGANVNAALFSGAALPGWRFTRDRLSVNLFAGPVVQDYRFMPSDPGSRLHGLYLGAQFAADVWYQPTALTMAAVNGTVTSIGPTGSLRAALGYRLFDVAFVGPETQEIWCINFQELQFGAHVTGWHIGGAEWSAGAGWSLATDGRSGPYLRINVNTRY
jgi:hypothetical protein